MFNRFNLIFLFFVVFLSPGAFAQGKEIRIKLIEVKGNHKIDKKNILSKLSLKEGDIFSPAQVQADLKHLYEMGFFENVEVESEGLEGGIALYFIVHEKPFLVDVVYEGNENIGKDRLEEKIPIKTQTFFDLKNIKSVILMIKGLYEEDGYYNTVVTPVTQSLTDNRVVLTFLIEEGDQAYIKTIRFEGNHAFEGKQLQKNMETSTYFWLTSWITESGRFKKDQMEIDQERIEAHYLNHGYLNIDVAEPRVQLSDDKAWFEITIPVHEGEQFSIGDISYSGNTLFESATLSSLTKSQAGAVFNRGALRQDTLKMIDHYGESGYIYANVTPDLRPDNETRTVDVNFRVTEGDPVQVREINISGNNKTRDKVIRREIRINEQERIDTKKLRRSFERLNNLNYFETINIVPRQVDRGWVDLDVEVKEKPTGTFSVGGGYSSTDKFVGTFDVTMGNFLGKGQLLKLKGQTGTRQASYSLTFREPYLFDRDLSGTFDLFNQLRDFGSYDERRIGGDVILGRSYGEYVRGSVSYTVETLDLLDLRLDENGNIDSTVPSQIQAQAALGKTLTSALGFSLSRDTRDFFFDPKEGGRNSLSLEYAGTFLGGDNAYYKIIADSSRFFPLWWDHVFSVHGRFGFAEGIDGEELPVGERFFVGGINTVRGFKFGKAGPLDELGEIKGGSKQLFFNVEYLIPLVEEAKIKLLFFYDYGAAFDSGDAIDFSGMRKAAGFGVRWISPLGPLRLEWGYNLDPEPGEPSRAVEFSIGSLF
ncbi:MAG: outer membrane protein assembly factor BamA [Nitrospiria bacterium]